MRRVMVILLQEKNFGPNVIYYVFVFLFVHFRHFFGTVSALLRCFVDARGTQRYSPAPSVLFWPPSAFSCGCLLKTKGAAPHKNDILEFWTLLTLSFKAKSFWVHISKLILVPKKSTPPLAKQYSYVL